MIATDIVMIRIQFILFFAILLSGRVFSQHQQLENLVSKNKNSGAFGLVTSQRSAPIWVDKDDFKGVIRAANDLKSDIGKVSGQSSVLSHELQGDEIVIIGTIGKSAVIDKLIKDKKIDVKHVSGKWESSLIEVIENPFPNVKKALVIAGSDKRGTIYGIYELSQQIGVSPWYYWADVPTAKSETLYITSGRFTIDSPKVQYRGIFLNDEAPALAGWAKATFGGFNNKFYGNVFELILRLKGNFLWPAMWGNAFFDDDPQNGVLANEYGIVVSTSHHEPMGRAHAEWDRYGKGEWDYTKNGTALRQFWKGGMERMKDYETIVTVGMRGDGDEPMSEESNVSLLSNIVNEQRNIIQEVTKKKAKDVPQVWALYKEVQEYYDRGMRVPDDITLLLCDDNWGNVRKLPSLDAKARQGGYGMYYHFDYVGGPRNYKWINVSQIQRIWEQMNLTYAHGVDKIWIVNVGDLKPMEYPISFFLDMAWDPEKFNADNLYQHTRKWSSQQFDEKYADETARLINLYTKYNRRVTPELLNDTTYSLENYKEFERVTTDYKDLALDAFRLYNVISAEYKDAFDQLVLFPINAYSNLYEMYYAFAKNRALAKENNPEANYWAKQVERAFQRDQEFSDHYHNNITEGKWKHMMDQIRIGYTIWQQPERSIMPTVIYIDPISPEQGIFLEKDGYIAIEAENYAIKKEGNVSWQVIPDLGKTKSGITTMPVTVTPNDSAYLEYTIQTMSGGKLEVHVLVSPTLNFNDNKGLRYAISIDGKPEQVVNFNSIYDNKNMETWQANSINESVTIHEADAGTHRLRFRALDPGVVLQKIIINTGGLKKSYLGPPESILIRN